MLAYILFMLVLLNLVVFALASRISDRSKDKRVHERCFWVMLAIVPLTLITVGFGVFADRYLFKEEAYDPAVQGRAPLIVQPSHR